MLRLAGAIVVGPAEAIITQGEVGIDRNRGHWCGLAVSELGVTTQRHAAAVGVPQAAPRHPEVKG